MSTTARKRRKRLRRAWGYPEAEVVRTEKSIAYYGRGMGRFQHPVKVGTPIAQRARSMQQTDRIDQAVMSKLGLFSAIRQHLGIGKNGRGR